MNERVLKLTGVVLRPGVIYNGDWKENVGPHGFGSEVFSDSSCYKGRWLSGKRHGPGKEFDRVGKLKHSGLFFRGNRYVGDWKENVGPHGVGRELTPEGKVLYHGEWVNGIKEGKAYLDGVLYYDGHWRCESFHGSGKLYTRG